MVRSFSLLYIRNCRRDTAPPAEAGTETVPSQSGVALAVVLTILLNSSSRDRDLYIFRAGSLRERILPGRQIAEADDWIIFSLPPRSRCPTKRPSLVLIRSIAAVAVQDGDEIAAAGMSIRENCPCTIRPSRTPYAAPNADWPVCLFAHFCSVIRPAVVSRPVFLSSALFSIRRTGWRFVPGVLPESSVYERRTVRPYTQSSHICQDRSLVPNRLHSARVRLELRPQKLHHPRYLSLCRE